VKDGPQRRNRVAAITATYYAEIADRIIADTPEGKTIAVDTRIVRATYAPILAALAGETRPAVLGIDELSLPALQIATIVNEEP
jgi:hypothetical protein